MKYLTTLMIHYRIKIRRYTAWRRIIMHKQLKILTSLYITLLLIIPLTPLASAAQPLIQIQDWQNDYTIVNNIQAFNLAVVDIERVELYPGQDETLVLRIDYYNTNPHLYVKSNGEALTRTEIKFTSLDLKFFISLDTFMITRIFNVTYDIGSSSPVGEWIKIEDIEFANTYTLIYLASDNTDMMTLFYSIVHSGQFNLTVKTSLMTNHYVVGYSQVLSYDVAPSPPPHPPPPPPPPPWNWPWLVVLNNPLVSNITIYNPPTTPIHAVVDITNIEVSAVIDQPGSMNRDVLDIDLTFVGSAVLGEGISHIGVVLDIGSPEKGWISTAFNTITAGVGFVDENPRDGLYIDKMLDGGSRAKIVMKQEGNWAEWSLHAKIEVPLDANTTMGKISAYEVLEPIYDKITAKITILVFTDDNETSGSAFTLILPVQTVGDKTGDTATTSGEDREATIKEEKMPEESTHSSNAESQKTVEPPEEPQFPDPDKDAMENGTRIPDAVNTGTIAIIIVSVLAGFLAALLLKRK